MSSVKEEGWLQTYYSQTFANQEVIFCQVLVCSSFHFEVPHHEGVWPSLHVNEMRLILISFDILSLSFCYVVLLELLEARLHAGHERTIDSDEVRMEVVSICSSVGCLPLIGCLPLKACSIGKKTWGFNLNFGLRLWFVWSHHPMSSFNKTISFRLMTPRVLICQIRSIFLLEFMVLIISKYQHILWTSCDILGLVLQLIL